MSGARKLAELLYDLQRNVKKLGSSAQLSNTTVAGENAVAVSDVVTEAAVTNDALPAVQEDAADSNEGISDLTAFFDSFDADMAARFEQAEADLENARAEIADSEQDIQDAFGTQFEGMSADIQTAITAAGNAQSAADAKPLILFSAVRGPSDQSDLAPTGSTWFLLDTANNIAGQWQQTGPAATPTWTPRQIVSDVIANLDVGKLTAGQAAIATLVAQKIAASTANFQTVNVSNLFVTDGATMNQATIDYLFANVVQAKKITVDMLDVNTFNGVTVSGLTITGGTIATIPNADSGSQISMSRGVATFTNTSEGSTGTLSMLQTANRGYLKLYVSGAAGDSGSISIRPRLTADGVENSLPRIFTSPLDASTGLYAEKIGSSTGTNGTSTPEVLAAHNDNGWVVTAAGSGGSLAYASTFGPSASSTDYVIRNGSNTFYVRNDGTVMASNYLTITDTSWINLPITAGSADSTNPPQYRRLGGTVFMRGLITPGTTLQTIGNLPTGFRPGISGEYACVRTAGGTATVTFWDVRVQAGGNVALMGPSGGSGNVNLNGIQFIAEN